MLLFERVKLISETLAPSQTALAKALGLSQSKFYHYLNPISEKNLWAHLPQLLEMFPQISREWLYFDKGEMLLQPGQQPSNIVAKEVNELRLENERLKAELTELQKEFFKAQAELLALYKEKAAGQNK